MCPLPLFAEASKFIDNYFLLNMIICFPLFVEPNDSASKCHFRTGKK